MFQYWLEGKPFKTFQVTTTCITYTYVWNKAQGEPAVSYRWTNWVWKITSRELPIILKESLKEYTSIEWKQNRKMSTCNRLHLEWHGSWPTLYAQKLPGHLCGNKPTPSPFSACLESIYFVHCPWMVFGPFDEPSGRPWALCSGPITSSRSPTTPTSFCSRFSIRSPQTLREWFCLQEHGHCRRKLLMTLD